MVEARALLHCVQEFIWPFDGTSSRLFFKPTSFKSPQQIEKLTGMNERVHAARNEFSEPAKKCKTFSCVTLLRKKGFDPAIMYTENGY